MARDKSEENENPRSLICAFYIPTPRNPMPTYHVELLEGRTQEQKKKLVDEVTRVTVETLGCSPEAVDIIITDVKRDNWATGGKFWSEPRA